MPKKEIKAILFDAGRVFNDYDFMLFATAVKPYSPYSLEEIVQKIKKDKMMDEYYKGTIESKDFFESVKKKIKAKDLTYDKFEIFWKNTTFFINYEMEKILSRVKPEILLLILSNQNELQWNDLSRLEFIKKYFPEEKQRIISYKVGTKKPEGEIYEKLLKRYRILAQECVFIDDKKENLEKFEKMGGFCVKYDCRFDSIEKLRNKLEKFGVFREE